MTISRWTALVFAISAVSRPAAAAGELLTPGKTLLSLAATRTFVALASSSSWLPMPAVIELTRMDAAQGTIENVGIAQPRTTAICRRPSRAFEKPIRTERVAGLAPADSTPRQGLARRF